ncbi:MAG: hypothetical protein ABEJ35_02720 [Halobacteriaceae archaeon]
MSIVLVLTPPPAALSLGVGSTLDGSTETRLATALLQDACRAGAESGGDLLVAVRDDEGVDGDTAAAQAAVRTALEPVEALDAEAVRIERAVGSTPSARLGNTVTHLLEEEEASSVIALWPRAPLVGRAALDGMAMKLRRDPVVLAPAAAGRLAFAGFTESIDFTDCLQPPALTTVTDRALDAGLAVDFVDETTRVDGMRTLASALVQLRARRRADRIVPPATAAAVDALDLRVAVADDGDLTVVAD